MIIKKLLLLTLGTFLFTGCGFFSFNGNNGLNVISSELTKEYISYLASDSLKGRNTPSPELDSAAVYIASEFKEWGLQPVKDSYLQKLNLGFVNLGTENHLKLISGGTERNFNIKTEFTPFEMTANKEITAPLVFAGYGITAPEYNYDDYEGIDVKGKVVFILRHEPGEQDSASVFDGLNLTDHSDTQAKVDNAIEHGAAAVLLCTDPINHNLLSPRGFPWPSLSRIIPKDALPLSLMAKESEKVPVVHVGEDFVKVVFGSVDSLKKLQQEIDRNLRPVSFDLSGKQISVKTSTEIKETPAYNVVGFIEGSDPVLKEEVVVIGAHYDHVGYKKEYKEGEDYIYNGADDNASGTAAMMTVAAGLGSQTQKPRRSVLFIAFAGEEKGLFGSLGYVTDPLFPLEKTVAMLNLDMVGRNHPDTLYIVAGSRSPELSAINDKANQQIGFTLVHTNRHIAQSDHASFLRNNIPVLFYHTGEEAEYHKVTDEVELIDFEKAAKVSRLVFLTALNVANDSKYYKVTSKKISLF